MITNHAFTPPVQGDNLWVLAGSDYSSVGFVPLPQDWKTARLLLRAEGDTFWIAFSTSDTGNSSSSKTAASASGTTTQTGNELHPLDDGEEMEVDLRTTDPHRLKSLIVLSDTGAGALVIRRASGGAAQP